MPYTNNLYVYPINLKYDSQKTYTKVRFWIVVFHKALNLVRKRSTCKNDTLANLNDIYKQLVCTFISHQLKVWQLEDIYLRVECCNVVSLRIPYLDYKLPVCVSHYGVSFTMSQRVFRFLWLFKIWGLKHAILELSYNLGFSCSVINLQNSLLVWIGLKASRFLFAAVCLFS